MDWRLGAPSILSRGWSDPILVKTLILSSPRTQMSNRTIQLAIFGFGWSSQISTAEDGRFMMVRQNLARRLKTEAFKPELKTESKAFMPETHF